MRGRAKKLETNPIAYTIKDSLFGEIQIQNSANAWWLEKRKVESLIVGFKMGLNGEEVCCYVGITPAQRDYFLEKHPYFSEIIPTLKLNPRTIAKITLFKGLSRSAGLSMDYLKNVASEEFSTKSTMNMTATITPQDIAKELGGGKDVYDEG